VADAETHNKVEITWSHPTQLVNFHWSRVSRQQGVQVPPVGTETLRHMITQGFVITLTCSIVGACLEYCNSLFYGAQTSTVAKLQRLQQPRRTYIMPLLRSIERVACYRTHANLPLLRSHHWPPINQPRRTHVKPLLRSIHWPPINQEEHTSSHFFVLSIGCPSSITLPMR